MLAYEEPFSINMRLRRLYRTFSVFELML